jgi:TolB-like protein/DNA-binding winged helix-turn-helix (wHTH) protein/Tfp pilus assembly protein PilF
MKFDESRLTVSCEVAMDAFVKKVFRFEGYTLDLLRGALRNGGSEIELRPKSFEVLCYFVANPGRLLTKDEILKAVWQNIFVTEDSLVRCVHDIRHALGDVEQRLIRTMPRRGYRFDAAVSCSASDPSDEPEPAGSEGRDPEPGTTESFLQSAARPLRQNLPQVVAIVVAALAAVAAGIYVGWPYDRPLPEHTSIAVLPFADTSGGPRNGRIGYTISEDLITNLSKFPGIAVAARNAAFAYEGKGISARQVGRALSVRYVLEGSVRADGEQLRISAQLIDAGTGNQLWAERYDRPALDTVSAHDEVSREIAATLASAIRKEAAARAAHRPVAELSALDLVLRASELSANNPDRKSALEARALFRRAIEVDPSNVTAHELLGREYYRGFVLQWDGPEALNQAYALAQRAMALDNTSASTYDLLGRIYLRRRQHDLAVATIEKAIALNPNRPESYATLADTLTFAGRAEEAVELLKTAMHMNPHHPPYFDMYLGRALYFAGRYDQAILALDTCVARAPEYRPCYMYLAPVYAELGRMEDARRTVEWLQAVSPGFSIDKSVRRHLPYAAKPMERFIVGLRKAGVSE